VYDLESIIARDGPTIEPRKDPAYFSRVFLDMGALAWRNGLELSPSAIHRRLAEADSLRPADAAA
jgi:hypothetical protein